MGESAFFAGRLRPEAAALQLLPDLMVLGLAFFIATADHSRLPLWRCSVFMFREERLYFGILSQSHVNKIQTWIRIRIYENIDGFN